MDGDIVPPLWYGLFWSNTAKAGAKLLVGLKLAGVAMPLAFADRAPIPTSLCAVAVRPAALRAG